MPTAQNARLDYEAAQTLYAMAALTDSGDHTTFTNSADYWSQKSGYAPVIRPNGVVTGGEITPTAGQSDKVDVAAMSINLNGVVTAVAGSSGVVISRGVTTDTHRITSITVNAGGSIVAVAGVDSTAFSETRGADGGPPLIAVDSVEIGQIRVTSVSAGAVTESEVRQIPGTHQERANYPSYQVDPLTGSLTFAAALPLSHTGPTAKKVFAEVYEPDFAEVVDATSFVPPETTHSLTSTQVYKRAIGATSSSLNQGSFSAMLEDGVTDPLVTLKDEKLFFKFYPDENKSAHMICVGTLGLARTFPADNLIQGNFTINAEYAAVEKES
jgi:hypothetical protein